MSYWVFLPFGKFSKKDLFSSVCLSYNKFIQLLPNKSQLVRTERSTRGLATPDENLHSAPSNPSIICGSDRNLCAREQPIQEKQYNNAAITRLPARSGAENHTEQTEIHGMATKDHLQPDIRHQPTEQAKKSDTATNKKG